MAWRDVAGLLETLPEEVLLRLLSGVPGSVLRTLGEHSQTVGRLCEGADLRGRWVCKVGRVRLRRATHDPHELARLVSHAWTLSEGWARAIYWGEGLFGRVRLVSALLEDRATWPLARSLASLDEQADAKMSDPHLGVFHRHLRWRFVHHGCPLADTLRSGRALAIASQGTARGDPPCPASSGQHCGAGKCPHTTTHAATRTNTH